MSRRFDGWSCFGRECWRWKLDESGRLVLINWFWPCNFSPKQRKEKQPVTQPFKNPKVPTTAHPKLAQTPRTPKTFSEFATSSQPSTTPSSTLLISQAVKPTPVSLEVWKSRPTEKSHLPTLLCLPPSTSAENSRLLASTLFTSSLEDKVVLWPRLQDLVPSLLLEPSLEMDSRLAESRMSPQHQLTQPEERTVAVVEDCDHTEKNLSLIPLKLGGFLFYSLRQFSSRLSFFI